MVVEDLSSAVENLPIDPDAVKVGKLTKWAAEDYQVRGLMDAGDYAKAETAAENAVINSGYFHLMEDRLQEKRANGDVFSDLFVENNQNRNIQVNMESIWVMQFEYNTRLVAVINSDD